jgi:aspartate/methionine/tyrosine aminotransferase
MFLSQRTKYLVDKPSMIVEASTLCASDPFSEENPTGYVNFGVAENHLMEGELFSKINSLSLSTSKLIHYNSTYGTSELREAYVSFLQKFFSLKNGRAEEVIVAGGATSILEMISFCFFNSKDKIAIPAPYYLGFDHDFSARFGAKILPYHSELDGKFYSWLKREKVKAVLITRPDNPSGKVLKIDLLRELMEFCHKNKIHLIIDEVYALTNLSDNNFTSFLSLLDDSPYFHHVYSMAKDFSLSGFKVGFFYSRNAEILKGMQAASYFYTPSNQTQDGCTQLLTDHEWISAYLKENKKRLLQNLDLFERELKPHFPFARPEAAFFLYPNFDKLAELHHLQGDHEIFNFLMNELKVNILPGAFFHDGKSGNFRVCFARDKLLVNELIRRFKEIL